MKSNAMVRLHAVSKKYVTGEGQGIVALDSVSLDISPGSVVGITGPSGSGKSTLLHVIGAMDRPNSGSIQVDHNEVTAFSRSAQAEYRRGIGFVFQQFHLLPALTLVDNVAAPVLPYRTDYDKFERAHQLLEDVGLGERAGSLPSKLSGGQQQRVAIARSLINQPSLLLADEPTGNLDSKTGEEIMDLILGLRDRHGMTVLIASHDALVASRCDRVVRIADGAIVADMDVSTTMDPDELLGRIGRLGGP